MEIRGLKPYRPCKHRRVLFSVGGKNLIERQICERAVIGDVLHMPLTDGIEFMKNRVILAIELKRLDLESFTQCRD